MARPSFKEVAEREAKKAQETQLPIVAPIEVTITPNPNQTIMEAGEKTATTVVQTVAPIEAAPVAVVKEEVKLTYGNKDKAFECVLPKGFKQEKDFFVKIWRTQELEDKTLITIPSSIDFVVYDEDNFEDSFKGYKEGLKTPFERVTGMKYQVLHNPN